MSLPPCETAKPNFSPEAKHVLGMLYNFLIDLGRQRLRRLELQSRNGEQSRSASSTDLPVVGEKHRMTSGSDHSAIKS